MSIFDLIGLLIALCAVFGFLNARLLRLPDVIGITAIGVIFSLGLTAAGSQWPAVASPAVELVRSIDFPEVMFHGMLGMLLFAGSLHVNLGSLSSERWPILVFATVGVLISSAVVAAGAHVVSGMLGFQLPVLYCLIFGVLISPTDPIAVLSVLKTAGVPKQMQTRITGESLFNDGTAVVAFLVLLGLLRGDADLDGVAIASMFALEAGGGLVLGAAIGMFALFMLRQIDSYAVEILLTLAVVFSGYSLAEHLHVSAPLYVVAAGLVIGNLGPRKALSKVTQEHLFGFWTLLDELLNLLLFCLVGLELLAISMRADFFAMGVAMIGVVLFARMLSVGLPLGVAAGLIPRAESRAENFAILSWGGLRGGISIALALSLPSGPEKEAILTMTYVVVIFSILIQATTLSRLIGWLAGRKSEGAAVAMKG